MCIYIHNLYLQRYKNIYKRRISRGKCRSVERLHSLFVGVRVNKKTNLLNVSDQTDQQIYEYKKLMWLKMFGFGNVLYIYVYIYLYIKCTLETCTKALQTNVFCSPDTVKTEVVLCICDDD